jgi:hypothetical protein
MEHFQELLPHGICHGCCVEEGLEIQQVEDDEIEVPEWELEEAA